MLCPLCSFENVAGTDDCGGCGESLVDYDTPGRRDDLERSLIETTVDGLEPASPILVAPETTLSDVVARMREHRIGAVLVGTPDEVHGIFSERDLLLRVAHRWDDLRDASVAELMTPDPETVDADAPLAFALNKMEVGDFRHVPVTRGGRLCGVISARDVVDFLAREYPDLFPAA